MNVMKCDLCNKTIKDDKYVLAGTNYFLKRLEVCYNCGEPVVEFLKKHKFLNDETSKTKK